ncbi:MAG: DUF3160 domain-containing protein [Candidatus Hydrogenedentes bacterium]|nr:DUF3160 domain-containing protein [Candidatus Hydrogenedentota bacterium]
MRERWMGGVGRVVLGAILLIASPILGEAPLFVDLSVVQGIAHYSGPDAGKDLLSKNGFVVTREFQHHIFVPYLNDNLPHFVTADSVHRTFHVLLEDHLKLVETRAAGEVNLMLAALRASLEAQPPDAVATGALAPLAAEAKALALAYLQVAEVLLAGDSVPAGLPEGVAAEVAAILNADGFGASRLFGEEVDYSQYKPRGFYTESPELQRYFRAMSWFGNAAFLLGSDVQTLAALMLSKALQDTQDAQQRWRKLDRLYTRFLGPCDDLTPEEYGAHLPGIGMLDSPAALADAIARLREELRDPRINSMLTVAEKSEWVAQTKGMRFMGKRYLPDSEIFLALVEPNVARRVFPSGLDLMAANGSARAAELMAGTPEGSQPDYSAAAAKSRGVVSTYKRDSDTHYAAILRLAETLTAPPVEQAAPFARTSAYGDKNLMTSLAAWASTRHTWALHAKQSNMMRGGEDFDPEDPPPGYVEPNPTFFSQMTDIVTRTTTLFGEAGLADLDKFEQFGSLVGELAEIVRKELAGDPLSENERHLLKNYGIVLKKLHGMEGGNSRNPGSSWMSLVMDVYTYADTGQCLEVATGGAMPIYVILEHGGKPHLLVGSVYSYYEFQQPISARLNDEEWREQWDEGRVPELPAWSGSFVAGGHDVQDVIARLRNGEYVSGLEFIQDPALDAYLVENVRPDSPSLEKENVAYLFYSAARRAPDVVNPILVNMIRSGDLDTAGARGTKTPSPEVAAVAISGNVREEDLQELVDIMTTTNAIRAKMVGFVFSGYKSDILATIAIEAITRCADPILKCELLDLIRSKASLDCTPDLLKNASTEEGAMQFKYLHTLATIWRRWNLDSVAFQHLSTTETEAQREQWSAQLDAAVLEALATFDWVSYDSNRDTLRRESETLQERAMKDSNTLGHFYGHKSMAEYRWVQFQVELMKEIAEIIMDLRLEGAVPFLAESLNHADRQTTAIILKALATIGTDESTDVLANSAGSPHLDPVLKSSFRTYMYDREIPDSSSPGNALIRLLEHTSSFGGGGLRVCDIVLGILADTDIPGHPGLPPSASLADRDAKLAEWIAYLQEQPLPSDYEDDDHGFGRPGPPRALSAPGGP